MIISLVHEVFNNVRKGKEHFLYSLNTKLSSVGQVNGEHLYFYFQASSSDVSLLLVSVSESSPSAFTVLLHGENRLELRLSNKPFFPNPFLRSYET